MGIIKERLKSEGYNLKERIILCGGLISGVAAPIAGIRYLILPAQTDNALSEVACWGASILTNLSPLIIKKPPIPFYTGIFGGVLGSIIAENSRWKRLLKKENKNLESDLNHSEQIL